MPHDRLSRLLEKSLSELAASGRAKGRESVVRSVIPARDGHGPRFLLGDTSDDVTDPKPSTRRVSRRA